MNDCPFCSIDPTRCLAERPSAVLIWDAFPVSKGHALVVPRRHFDNWFDATPRELAACAELVKVARTLIEASHSSQSYNIGVNVGATAGQTVPHAHVHVIPRYAGDAEDPAGGVRHVISDKANYLNPAKNLNRSTTADSDTVRARALITGTREDPLLPQLIDALDRATDVDIVAAFVLQSGVNLIKEHLVDVLDRGGRVRVLTGDYFSVTEPSALRTLLDLDGSIEVRVCETEGSSFHPKAYLVSEDNDEGVAFVGSSNLTKTALLDGVEWNYRIVRSTDKAGFAEIVTSFEGLWSDRRTKPVDEDWIRDYAERRKPATSEEHGVDTELEFQPPPEPHTIQAAALDALANTRSEGNAAGLVVLATGLGKTWLSAFDSQQSRAERVLFIAHREEILRQARATFRRIRPDATLGTYSGQEKQPDADVLFASIQTLSRKEHLHHFEPGHFDYVVVDEFHHASARTYRRVLAYFEPQFLLGLTATPERSDGADLLQLCGNNLVYRVDVGRGIKEKLLSPFDYFGVPDLVDYKTIPWRNTRFDAEALTTAVATRERATNAYEQLQRHGGTRTLAFCVSQRHADYMAEFLRHRGVRAVAVHSGSSTAPRAHSLERLQAGDLDVVCAVDMFNEGVDLPDVDTVLMLRPTESRILWLQQFGRGLRFRPEKRLQVIDYIGNHRIFLTKTQALLGLGNAEREVAHALEQLDAGTFELPPGCSVTYELEAKEILRSLIPPASKGQALEEYYRDRVERVGSRPSAENAFFDGFNPRATRRAGRGIWFDFVNQMGDLDEVELKLFREHEHFFSALETTAMTKSYKMLVLVAMLGAGELPGEIHIDTLVERVRDLIRRYTQLRDEVGEVLEDAAGLRRLLRDNPIAAWTGTGAMKGEVYFDFDGTQFSSRIQVAEDEQTTFADLTHEIVEWRLAEYLSRSPAERGPDHFVCRVSQSSGRPILFLPPREGMKGLPEGWIDVVADGRALQANFVKVAVNVVTERGQTSNALPDLLRSWFGSAAGARGRTDRVVFQVRDGSYEMRPMTKDEALPEGPVLWARYTRAEAFETVRVEPKGQEAQHGVVYRPDQLVFFVTLDKRSKEEAYQYDDAFLSPKEFKWQSQNQTSRESKRGKQIGSGMPIHLFVRRQAKVRSKTSPFVYAGHLEFLRWEGGKPITVWWRLEEPVPDALRDELVVPSQKQ